MGRIEECLDILADVAQESQWEHAYDYLKQLSEVDSKSVLVLKQAIATPLDDYRLLHKIFAVAALRDLGVKPEELLPELLFLAKFGQKDERGIALGWLVVGVEDEELLCNQLRTVFREYRPNWLDKIYLYSDLVERCRSLRHSLKLYRRITKTPNQ